MKQDYFMKRLWLVVLLVVTGVCANAQIKSLLDRCDSLKAGSVGSKANILERSKMLLQTALQGLALVPQGDALDSAKFLSYAAYAYTYRMDVDPDTVRYYYSETLDKALVAGATSLIANACGSLIHIEMEMGQTAKADDHKKILLSILDTTSDQLVLRDGYSILGSYYQQKAYYTTAQDYYIKSIQLRKRQLDTTGNPKIRVDYANQCYLLAKLYMNTDMPDKALNILYEGSRYKGITGLMDYRLISSFIDVFCKTGRIDSALYYLHHRVDSLETKFKGMSSIPAEVVMPNLSVAQYYISHGQLPLALPFLDKADSLTRGRQASFLIYEIQRIRGKYLRLTGEPAKAIPLLTAALPMARMLNREDYTDILEDLALSHKAAGNTTAALQYYDQHRQSMDSLTNEKISRIFADQETRYQTNEKEEKIAILDKDNKLNVLELGNARHARLLLIVGLVIVGAFALILSIVYRNKEQLNKKLALANDTKARLFGIIGHDLRAPVSSIIQLLSIQQQKQELQDPTARRQYEEKIRQASSHLLEAMEDLLLWSKSQLSHLTPDPFPVAIGEVIQREVQLVHGMMEARKLQVKQDVPAELTHHTDENFLSVIIRNLLQNAVKYSERETTIHIHASDKSITISNTTSGIHAADMNARLLMGISADSRTSGLGLQVSRDLATTIGATISFRNEGSSLAAMLQWRD
jgi:signal transduction histidine kinase